MIKANAEIDEVKHVTYGISSRNPCMRRGYSVQDLSVEQSIEELPEVESLPSLLYMHYFIR